MPSVYVKRGTRAQINAAQAASGLHAGELYLVTDENKMAVGTAVNSYVDVSSVAFQRGATFVNSSGLATPVNAVPVIIPVACTIASVTVVTQGGTGSCVIDIWRDSYTNYPPTVADSICSSNKPTISSGTKYQNSTLTGWTTTLSAGDILFFNLDSVSGFTLVDITLVLNPT